MWRFLWLGSLALFVASCSSSPKSFGTFDNAGGEYQSHPKAQVFAKRMAQKHNFDEENVLNLLSHAKRYQWAIDYYNGNLKKKKPKPKPTTPAKPVKPKPAKPVKRRRGSGSWTRYRKIFINEKKLSAGADFWNEHADTLARAESVYGVPAQYIVAIIGVETYWGRNFGKTKLIDSLTTLAFDLPRREKFFTRELENYLLMAREEGMDPLKPVGSFAGAMGYGQFMPSSFRRYAVDFNGDGVRDIWNVEDAIGSVANYFIEHGWQSGESVAVPANREGSDYRSLKKGHKKKYPLSTFAAKGITPLVELNSAGDDYGLILLSTYDAEPEVWLGAPNFYVILRYNYSSKYAMAVHQLGEAIKARIGR